MSKTSARAGTHLGRASLRCHRPAHPNAPYFAEANAHRDRRAGDGFFQPSLGRSGVVLRQHRCRSDDELWRDDKQRADGAFARTDDLLLARRRLRFYVQPVLAANLLADAVHDAFDPRRSGSSEEPLTRRVRIFALTAKFLIGSSST